MPTLNWRCLWGLPVLFSVGVVHAEENLDKSYLRVPESVATTEKEMKPYRQKLRDTSFSYEMVPIPSGEFVMGSPAKETSRAEDEGPQHKVHVDTFWMGKCEVTWDEYDTFRLSLDAQRRDLAKRPIDEHDKKMDGVTRPTREYTDMTFGMGRDGYPAICMTQFAAKQYCLWLSEKTGQYHRLPTEAEWEYACRAGTTTAYSFGDDPSKLDDYAWHEGNSDDKSHPVGKKKPNPWGLHDMYGSVNEWCLDRYDAKFYAGFDAAKAAEFPLCVPTGDEYPRVTRGGSWNEPADKLRSSARNPSTPDWKYQDPQLPKSRWYLTDAQFVGFRVIRPLVPPKPEDIKRLVLYPDTPKGLESRK